MPGGLIPRMIVAGALHVLTIGAVLALALLAIDHHRDADRRAAASAELLALDNDVKQLVLDLDRVELGYLASHDPALLHVWETQRDTLADRSTRLERLAHSAGQAELARRITRDGQSYVGDHATMMLQAEQRGDALAHSAATLRKDELLVTQLCAELDRLAEDERRLAAQHAQDLRAADSAAVAALITGVAGAVLVTGGIIGYLAYVVVRPVRRAVVLAGRLARGELDVGMPETGAAEIGQLTRALNVLSSSVRASIDDLVRYGRTQAVLRRVATQVARGAAPAEVLGTVAAELGQLIGTDGAHIARFDPEGAATVVAAWGTGTPAGTRLSLEGDSVTASVRRTGRPARMDTYAEAGGPLATSPRRNGTHRAVGVPIVIEGRLWGAVEATVTGDRALAPDAEARLSDGTDLIVTAIANAQARNDLAASRLRAVVAADHARRQIERDVHDGVQQQLIATAIDAGDAEAGIPPGMPKLRRRLSAITHQLNAALEALREISRGIHPTILTDRGLRPALKSLARRSRVPVELDVRIDRRLPEPVEITTYYVAVEALANAAEHAHASYVRIEAIADDERLRLTVSDDGSGGADPARGSGLVGLADRLDALGGTLTITSPPGQGTQLHAELPLNPAPPPPLAAVNAAGSNAS